MAPAVRPADVAPAERAQRLDSLPLDRNIAAVLAAVGNRHHNRATDGPRQSLGPFHGRDAAPGEFGIEADLVDHIGDAILEVTARRRVANKPSE